MTDYTIPETIVLSGLGIIAVFLVLAILMYFIKLMTAGFKTLRNRKKLITSVMQEQEETKKYAKGSCGDIKLYNVPDKEAAMIMAVVADELKMPLNELRFISIKETEE